MEECTMMYEQCKDILLKEHEAVQQAAALQNVIQNAILKREWIDFEAHLEALNGISIKIAIMERDREALFAALASGMKAVGGTGHTMPIELAGGDKGRFYTLCIRFTAEQRDEISSIYRSLKLEALKLRLANESLLKYLGEIKTTLAGFFELAFPDRGGKIYTPKGTPFSHDMRSMVLNQSM